MCLKCFTTGPLQIQNVATIQRTIIARYWYKTFYTKYKYVRPFITSQRTLYYID